MSIKLPTSVPIPRTGLGAALGKGLGAGIASGANQATQLLNKLGMARAEAFKKETVPYTAKEMNNELEKGYGFKLEDVGDEKDIQKLLDKTNELTKRIGRKKAIEDVAVNIDKYLSDEVDTPGEQLIGQVKEEQQEPSDRSKLKRGGRHLWDDVGPGGSLAKGVSSSSAGKLMAILKGQSLKDYKKESTLGDKAGVWDNILYTVGNFIGDSPGFIAGGAAGAAGGALGGPAGAVAGAGAGAFALPKFLNSTLEEFMKHKEKGWKGSYEDYLKSIANVGEETMYAGALGGIFGSLSKVLPVMKAANPSIKAFFEATSFPRLKEYLGKSTVQAMGLVGAESIAKRELPSKEDVAGTFAQVFGLNLLELGTNRAKGIVERIRRTDKPAEAIDKIKTAADKAGIDAEKVKAGDEQEVRKLDRIVEDITKTYRAETKLRLPGEEVSKEKLAKREAATKEKAEKLAEAPLEEYLKEKVKKETPGEKAEKLRASKELIEVDSNIKDIEENIRKLNAAKERGIKTKRSSELVDNSIKGFEKQLKEVEAKRKELEFVAKKGKKLFSEEMAKDLAKKHVKELELAAKNPEGTPAREWERMFDRDQKYIDQAIEILKRGDAPIAPYKDYYIKTLEAYNEVYRNSLKSMDNAIELSKGKEKAELQKIRNKLNRNLSINEGKLTKHSDKLASKEAVKKGSPLLRHYLRQLKADLPGMEKPIIEYKKAVDGLEAKTEKVFSEKIKKSVKSVYENPSEAKIENIIDENTKSEKEKATAKEDVNQAKEEAERQYKNVKDILAEAVKKGKSSSWIAKKIFKLFTKDWLKNYKTKIGKALAGAIVFGGIRKGIEEATGYKVPFQTIAFLMPFTKGIRFGAASFGFILEKVFKGISETRYKKEYQGFKSASKRKALRLKLKDKGWSPQRIKKVTAR